MTTVHTTDAPAAIGPYSQAKIVGNFVFASGQIPVNPATGAVESEDIEGQAAQSCKNVAAIMEAAGTSIEKVFKTTCFLADMNDFAALNGVYAEMFGETKPARSCVEVARLPKDVKVEIECIAAC